MLYIIPCCLPKIIYPTKPHPEAWFDRRKQTGATTGFLPNQFCPKFALNLSQNGTLGESKRSSNDSCIVALSSQRLPWLHTVALTIKYRYRNSTTWGRTACESRPLATAPTHWTRPISDHRGNALDQLGSPSCCLNRFVSWRGVCNADAI